MLQHSDHVATSTFLPHGFCYLWNPALLITHVSADLVIGISYVMISIALAVFVHRTRRDIPFSRVFIAFGLFIVLCGMTHFVEVVTIWQPMYWTGGIIKVGTAAASVATAFTMPRTVPAVLSTIRDARLSRDRAISAARADALAAQNERLESQARALESERAAATALAAELADANILLRLARSKADDARVIAEQANKAKNEFLAVMSHELRTPLHAIGGYTQLLDLGVRGPVTEAQREDFRRIERAQKHLLSVITDILDFARIEAGNATFENVEFAVAPLVDDVVALVSPQLAVKQHTLSLSGLEDVAVFADREKTAQILTNLLANANQYTPSGGQITVTGTTLNDTATIAIQDTGCGVEPEKLETIFDPFVQADTGLTRAHQGTGLGLAISRQLARGMAGDISVTSTIGGGSIFSLSLPRASTDRAGAGAHSRKTDAPTPDVTGHMGLANEAPRSNPQGENWRPDCS